MQTEPQVTFRMEVFTSFHIDVMYPAANMLLQQISTYQSNGSGWVVDHFIDVSLGRSLLIPCSLSDACMLSCNANFSTYKLIID